MEEYVNGLTSYTITEWINSDKDLYNCIIDIESTYKNDKEKAEAAFHKVSELYKVPKNPEDIVYDEDNEDEAQLDDYIEQSSVYEQLGLLKYLSPEEDIKGTVLTAIYFVKNGYVTDLEAVMHKYYETSNDKISGIGFLGENSNVEIVFIKKGQSWFDMGCKLFTRHE